ncbi:MAG TPA: sigma-70 family RNA polymerase sigma factor [Gemmatimonadaceae bacterium]
MTGAAPVERPLSALAAFAQLGDRQALEELLRRLQHPLSEHIRGIVRDDDSAADVLQDSLIIICRRLGTLREPEWVRAWAYRVATREAVRAAKRLRRYRGDPLDDVSEMAEVPTDDSQTDEELLAELPARLAALPLGAQVVLRLHYLQSLTQQEVAEALAIPLGTVKSRLAYGLSCLRREWVPPDSP